MKSFSKIAERVLAMAMAIIMVVGIMPLSDVFAVGGEVEAIGDFSATLKQETAQEEVVAYTITVEGLDQAPQIAWTVLDAEKALVGTVEVTATQDGGNYAATIDENSDLGEVTGEWPEAYTVQATVATADGRLLEVTEPDKKYTWSAALEMPENAVQGVAIELPEKPTAALQEGYSWGAVQVTGATADGEKYYVNTDATTVQVVYPYAKDAEPDAHIGYAVGTVIAGEPDATAFAYTVMLNGNALEKAGTHYSTVEKTEFTVSVDLGLDFKEVPDSIKTLAGCNWEKATGTTFVATKELEVNETTTVTFDGKEYTVVVDAEKPTVTDVTTYTKNGEYYTSFNYAVGISGLNEVKLNGDVVTPDSNEDGCIINHGKEKPEKVEIVIVNNAGVSSAESANNSMVDLNAAITFKPGENAGVGDDGKLYAPNGKIVITVTGTDNDSFSMKDGETFLTEVVAKNAAGDSITEWTWTANDNETKWTCTISTSNGIGELIVTPGRNTPSGVQKGEKVNSWEYEGETYTSIAVDSTEYKATLTEVEPAKTADKRNYYDAALTYTVTINGTHRLNKDKSYIIVHYTENGVTKELEATFDYNKELDVYEAVTKALGDGCYITAVEVVAVDACGKELKETFDRQDQVDTSAPVIELVASKNVVAFVKGADGNWYAKLENATHAGNYEFSTQAVINTGMIGATAASYEMLGDKTVTVTATVKDYSIVEMGEDWTQSQVNGQNVWTKTFTVEVPAHAAGALDIEVPAVDILGYKATEAQIELQAEQTHDVKNVLELTEKDGVLAVTVNIDRRAPENAGNSAESAPVIELITGTTPVATLENGIELFNGAPSFTLNVQDTGVGLDSTVIASVKDGLEGVFLSTENVTLDGGAATISVLVNGENETNNAVLYLEISDLLGNTYYYQKTFAVDNCAPRITVEQVVDEKTAEIRWDLDGDGNDDVIYYDGEVVYNIQVSDINPLVAVVTYTYVEDGEVQTEELKGGDGSFTIKLTDGMKLTDISVVAEDKAKNGSQWKFDGLPVIVDMTPATVTVEKTTEASVQTSENVDYYGKEVTYTFNIQDLNGINNPEEQIIITYQTESHAINEGKLNAVTDKPVVLEPKDGAYSFTLKDGEKLVSLTVKVIDNAGKLTQEIEVLGEDKLTFFTYDKEKQVNTYSGHSVVVDMTAATATVTKTDSAYVQRFNGADYYNGELTYTLEIRDAFITPAGSAVVLEVTYQDGTGETIERSLADFSGENGIFTTSFTVVNGQALAGITISIKDNAGNVTDQLAVQDSDKNENGETITQFSYSNEKEEFTSTNPLAVVDMTRPVVNIAIEGNIASYYKNNGVVYVVLNEAVTGNSGELTTGEQTITLVVTATDKNLTLLENMFKVQGDADGAWDGEAKINEDTTLTYTQSITVAADATGMMIFDLTVVDLAGNHLETDGIGYTLVGDTEPTVGTTPDPEKDDGHIGGTIVLDRRRPTSGDDKSAPVITITPSITPTVSNNNLDLFNGAFSFGLTVTDGTENSNNSGLKTVGWTISDAKGVVAEATANKELEAGTYDRDFTIPVELAVAAGESNEVKLTITAVDNVGNTITYVKEFAVDNLAPRISVSYDNNDVRNDQYFKADRTATVVIEDINFDLVKSVITTQIPASAWNRNGDIYTATVSYTQDGEYTFAVASADKAGNATTTVDYGNSAAPTEFVLDKTAPVINVTYSPNRPVGKDNNDVQFYSQDLDVTVSINEVNFNAAEVISDFHDRNTLGNFRSDGNMHTAATVFEEGNEYSFSIEYTDLAGNPATTYHSDVFSVDKTAPTITITSGSMTNESLNIVQDDLVLGFTINDAQENLADIIVKVVHLNNNFQTEEVLGDKYYTITSEDDRTTTYVNMANIAKDKANDGIYVVTISAKDYANNNTALAPELRFSLNRFGSSFVTRDSFTADFLKPSADGVVYQSGIANKLVIQEINPNRVWQDNKYQEEGSKITVTVNGNAVVLEKGTDYTVNVKKEGAEPNCWYVYTYAIDPANFMNNEEWVDGKYAILLYSEDEAGNKNTNQSNAYSQVQQDSTGAYSGKIEFTLDHKAPIITILGIKEGDSLDAEFKRVEINLSDNTPSGIVVTLNGNVVALSDGMEGLADSVVWLARDTETGNYILNIPEANFTQVLYVSATDASGNISEHEVQDFLITSNWFIRAINNPWIVGGVALFMVIAIAVVVLIIKKKKQ